MRRDDMCVEPYQRIQCNGTGRVGIADLMRADEAHLVHLAPGEVDDDHPPHSHRRETKRIFTEVMRGPLTLCEAAGVIGAHAVQEVS